MSINVLIIGESGTGKSTAIRTLPPEQTFLINVINKPLPFRGSNKLYTKLSADGLTGNYYATDDHSTIMRLINMVNKKRPEIKYLVMDDAGYTLTNDFMRGALQKGYEKFSILARDFWEIMKTMNETRSDLLCFMLMHSDVDAQGKSKPKTIGKMLDEKVCIEGMFSCVLHSFLADGIYSFVTNNTGTLMAKSPMGLFDQQIIPNDLFLVSEKINDYLNKDISL